MKNILLGGVALGVMTLATAGVANAQAGGDKLSLALGGYFQFYGFYIDQEDGAASGARPAEPGNNRREFDYVREGEVWFVGKTTFDNGLTVGADIQMEAESDTDTIDESNIFFEGAWGKLILGSENGAGYLLQGTGPMVDANFDFPEPNYRVFNLPAGSFPGTTAINWSPNLDADTDKIIYLTPSISGFQAGISYSPENCEYGTNPGGNQGRPCTNGGTYGGPGLTNNAGETEHAVNLGARYSGEFSGVKILVTGAYAHADLEAPGAAATSDREQWQVTANFTYAGFSLGGGYFQDDLALQANDQDSFQVGLGYKTGPWELGASWLRTEVDYETSTRGDDQLDRVMVGGIYNLAPGVNLRGHVLYADMDLDQGFAATVSRDAEAWGIVLGTNVSF